MDKKKYDGRICPLLPSVYEYDDACALAEAYATGDADPVHVTEQCLKAAPHYDSVYISLTENRARMEAEAACARYKAKIPLSPLDGVPCGWKDLIDVKGAVTTAGSALSKNNPPAVADSPMVILASRAGLVCPGKLNTTEFAYSSIGINPHFGTPVNPHSKPGEPRIPGGSSCGSGAAVAAGILPIAIGSDTGGSIRIPSAFNGLTGFKPSVERYDRGGIRFLARTLDTPGPIARSVRDVIVMDRILRGTPRPDLPRPASLKGRCFVVEKSLLQDEKMDPAVREMLESAGNRLQKAGASVTFRDIPSFQAAVQTVSVPWFLAFECFTELKAVLDDPEKAARIDQRIRKRAEGTRNLDASIAIRTLWARQRLMKAIQHDLCGAIFILPSVPHGAPLLNELLESEEAFFHYIGANTRLTTPGNLMDMPGVNLPAGRDGKGMPLGLSLYASSGEDDRVLEAALSAEEALIYE